MRGREGSKITVRFLFLVIGKRCLQTEKFEERIGLRGEGQLFHAQQSFTHD